MSEAKKTIEIKCDTKDKINWHDLTEFQGELKERNNTDIEKAKKSILRFGWSFPFYVYKEKETNYVLDGHCRLKVLKELEKEGYKIPLLPCVYIKCKDSKEAKQKLLRLNSAFGRMTKKSVLEFADDITLDSDELALPSGEIDFDKKAEEEIEGEEEFTEELLEENNYLCLFFDNSIDWLQVETLFDIKKVNYQNANFAGKRQGKVRIINGTKFIQKMLESEK